MKWLRRLAVFLCALMALGGPLGLAGMAETPGGAEEDGCVLSTQHPAPDGVKKIPDGGEIYVSEVMTRDDAAPGEGGAETDDHLSGEDISEHDAVGGGQSDRVVALQNAASAARQESLKSEGKDAYAQPKGARMSLSELRAKFPAGKYWNHAHNPNCDEVDYSDTWTDIPCPANHSELIGKPRQTCNGYWSGGHQTGCQCHGYAEKLGFDATGVDPETWEKRTDPGSLYELKAGDLVRYHDDGHTVFVIDVDDEYVYYTECNEEQTCVIRWDKKATRAELAEGFNYVRVCPSRHLVNDPYCHCSADDSGVYSCTASNVPIYGSHVLGSEVIGYIPYDALVYLSMRCTKLVHVHYNGINGYADPRYFARYEPCNAAIKPSYTLLYLFVPGDATRRVSLCLDGNLPQRYRITLNTAGTGCIVEGGEWVNNRRYDLTVTGVEAADSTLYFELMDDATGDSITACEVKCRIFIERSELSVSTGQVYLNDANDCTQTIKVSAGGYIPDAFSFEARNLSDDIVNFDWVGDWYDNGSMNLKITGKHEGTTSLMLSLICQGNVRATAQVEVTVGGSARIEASEPKVNLSIPNDPEHRVTFRVTGVIPRQYSFNATEISSPNISIEMVGDAYWKDGALCLDARVKGVSVCSGTILLKLRDAETGAVKATLLLPVEVTKWVKPMDPPDMKLPPARTIGKEAFQGVAAKVIWLPEGVKRIEARAFASCPNLKEIYLPASLEFASQTAFSGVTGLTIYGKAGSYAESFASARGFAFTPVD